MGDKTAAMFAAVLSSRLRTGVTDTYYHKNKSLSIGSNMNIQDILDRPIAFHRCLVDIAGGVLPALMLSQAIYWSKRTDDQDGWFWKTRTEWQEETGMSRSEQETARKKLRATGFWHEELRDVPAKLYYRIDLNALQSSWPESGSPVGGNPANKEATIQPSISESTTVRTNRLLRNLPANGKNGHAKAQFALPLETEPAQPLVSPAKTNGGTSSLYENGTKQLSTQQKLFGVIVKTCEVDGKLARGQVSRACKTLLAAGYTVEQAEGFREWWNKNDFRGQRGQPPTVQQMINHFKQSIDSVTVAPTNGRRTEVVPQNLDEMIDENLLAMVRSTPEGSYMRQMYGAYL